MTDRLPPELADLDLRTVDPGLHDLARKRFAARDALGFVALTDNDRALRLVFDNRFALRAAGMYEQAPLEALTGGRARQAMPPYKAGGSKRRQLWSGQPGRASWLGAG